MKIPAFTACGLMFLAGCAGVAPPLVNADYGPPPDQGKAEAFAIAYLRPMLKDPDSIKQFALRSKPSQAFSGTMYGNSWTPGWLLCIEYNAKNSYGAYAGLARDAIFVRVENGELVIPPGTIGKIQLHPC